MIRIPSGLFRMGSDKHYPEEAPVHRVTISGFWIDRTPVTNRQFKQFVRATGQRIALSDIKNVNYSPYMSPPQVTLSVRRHTVFGETIAFCAPVSIFPLRSSAVINDLIDRVDAARQKC